MGALRIAAASLCLISAPAQADAVARWRPIIDAAAARFGLPAAWIERVLRAESAGLTELDGRPIRSSAGAMGLMQLMPATWDTMRRRLKLGANPDDPRDNILAGAFYLRLMHDRFGYPGLFAAYNLGPSGYAEHLARRRGLPRETSAYLAKLTGTVPARFERPAAAPPPPLFVVRREPPPSAKEDSPSVLFAVKGDAR